MMEYAKVILPAVSGWKELFRKELVKCLKWADSGEKMKLYQWCNETFTDEHPEILDEVFAGLAKAKNIKGVLIKMPCHTHQSMKKTG